jgi:hypothetical protein
MHNHPVCRFLLVLTLLGTSGWAAAQPQVFTRADTLRGSVTPERAWWDLAYYHLQIRVQPRDSTVSGSTTIGYRVLQPAKRCRWTSRLPCGSPKSSRTGRR